MSDYGFVKKCSRFLKALSDLNRLKILELLFNGELCVTDMVKALRIEQPKISHHLAILKRANVILARREGRRIIYSLHPGFFKKSKDASTIDAGFCCVEFRLREKMPLKKEEPGDVEIVMGN